MRQLELIPRTSMVAVVLILISVIVMAAPACAVVKASYVPSEYIITVTKGTSLDTVGDFAARLGCELVESLPIPDTYLIRMADSGTVRSLAMARTRTAVPVAWILTKIQPNYLKQLAAIPNDALWSKMWDMVQIRMPGAWDITKGNSSVIVAINDSGVARHPDLVDRLLPGYDFVDNDNDASPEVGVELESHGTHCAGTAAAQGNNQIGVCGVCWDGVKILPVRVGTAAGLATSAIVNGLDYAMRQGADVVNMSYGGYFMDDVERQMIGQLADAGVILVAAAGNDSMDLPHYPASFDEVVSVSATGPYEAPAPYTNYGDVDIAAPGGDSNYGEDGCIWSTFVSWVNGTPVYDYKGDGWKGTSMACPHVAGAAALLLSYGVPRGEVVERLLDSARPPKSGGMDPTYYGAGILDVQGALSNMLVRIIEPGKGADVTGTPHFRINARGVTPSSIKIYLDYADLDDNGIPDDLTEAQIVNSTNVNYFWDAATSTIEFDWLDPNLNLPQAAGPLSAGAHSVYVSGVATTGMGTASDWATFFVATRKMEKGIHLVSFPYVLTDRMTDTPAAVLPGADFSAGANPRSTMVRWIAAPRSPYTTAAIGYETYVPNTLLDRTWVTPSYTVGGISVPLGGGYYADSITGGTQVVSPVGSGFWVILPEDVLVDETYATLESQYNFDESKGFSIPLYKGWNLIGNPYTHDVPWRAVLFTYKGQTKSLLDAELNGWVRSTMFGYGGSSVGYVRVTDRDFLRPYEGYWLLARLGGIDESESLTVTILP